jgi:hypothetical protein
VGPTVFNPAGVCANGCPHCDTKRVKFDPICYCDDACEELNVCCCPECQGLADDGVAYFCSSDAPGAPTFAPTAAPVTAAPTAAPAKPVAIMTTHYVTYGADGVDRADSVEAVLDGALRLPESPKGSADDFPAVRVYVVSSGIDCQHAEFDSKGVKGSRCVPAYDALTGTACAADSAAGCADDDIGTGTHIAGTIAGKQVGMSPDATVYAVKLYANGEKGDVVDALDFVASQREQLGEDELILVALDLANAGDADATTAAVARLVDLGVPVVAPAGDSFGSGGGGDACALTPASMENVVAVGSLTLTTNVTGGVFDTTSDFSNSGPCVDLFAVGSDILSAWPGLGAQSNVFKTLSSTSSSMAAVAGAMANLMSLFAAAGEPVPLPATWADLLIQGANAGPPDKLLNTTATNRVLYVGYDDTDRYPTLAQYFNASLGDLDGGEP